MDIKLYVSSGVRIFLLVLLGTCCFFQVKESAEKYFEKSTTSSINFERRTSIKPPTFLFCQSQFYRSDNVLEQNNMSKFSYDANGFKSWPSNESFVLSAWKKITFDPEEIFKKNHAYVNGIHKHIQGQNLTNLFHGEIIENWSFSTLDTAHSGRCYSLIYSKPWTVDDFAYFHFKSGKVIVSVFYSDFSHSLSINLPNSRIHSKALKFTCLMKAMKLVLFHTHLKNTQLSY